MTTLRELAKHQPCMVRIPGVCMGTRDTTVLAHLNGAGMARKHNDLLGAWCCWACHEVIDGRRRFSPSHLIKQYHYEGMVRTIEALADQGLIEIKVVGEPLDLPEVEHEW